MFQMKLQDNMLEKLLNKMEVRNLSDEEFKALIIKILTGLERTVDELNKNISKKIENSKEPDRNEEYNN